ncbi:16S rRNA (cytidine(1402)-2'-O)-methyltransferase [Acidiferrobacter sp.]|jgi:16S rRNA (cytidine1402-2'-O)-methyltransferase|uniref:16S rRNA (cytidine(1402)-2'-O)-methyltransferase n=1 Tax=Acidiferrobacter sp. TaxID=1872107 RepID=UPI00260D1233|nr:16S rRNA (cytidine(1402)-2'-O)-methyltransferase [Acidiferrobacter sp.]
MTPGLYIVATPLGHLKDLSPRALEVLQSVNVIAAEDTRHSQILCRQWGIQTPLISVHDHNERDRLDGLLARLGAKEAIALISDAGTPLISDPGYLLVRGARMAGVPVYAVAGPSAITAALSVAGVPCDRFVFEGFPPAQAAARRSYFAALASEPRTLVFYESPHRLAASLDDLSAAFGGTREAALVRELTKRFEEGLLSTLGELAVHAHAHAPRGECVLVVRGAPPPTETDEGERVLTLLMAELPLRQAVDLAVAITGVSKKVLYARALELKRT